MRNLKKFLALVLAMAMAFSLMLSASAVEYKDYKDTESITAEFQEAVNVLTGLKVFTGDEDASGNTKFRPKDNITRAEAAAVIYRVATGDVAGTQVPLYTDYGTGFKDVTAGDWFSGYVAFCKDAGYIKGTSPTTFTPYSNVTGYELLAMLLRVVGYGKNNEFTGPTWQVSVATMAESLHITDEVKKADFNVTLSQPARREVVAELTFVTMTTVPTVTFTTALQYSDRESLTSTYKNPTLGQKIFGLNKGAITTVDKWGRPGYYWYKGGKHTYTYEDKDGNKSMLPIYTGGDACATVFANPVKVYTKRIAECDIAHDMDWSNKKIEAAYIDGEKIDVKDSLVTTDKEGDIDPLDTTSYIGGQGRVVEVYDMSKLDGTGVRLVEKNTYLAKVTRVWAATKDRNDHPVDAYSRLEVYVKSKNRTDSTKVNGDPNWDDAKTTWAGILHNSTTVTGTREDKDLDGIEDTITGNELATYNITTLYAPTDKFAVGSYVLVTANEDSVKNGKLPTGTSAPVVAADSAKTEGAIIPDGIKAATINSGGRISKWTVGSGLTAGTTTFTTSTTYSDADKFVLNRRSVKTDYSAAMDEYGNIIGLVNQVSNYLVIEKIEWKHSVGTIGDGYGLMNAILADGSRVENVEVSMVNGYRSNDSGDNNGDVRNGSISDYYKNNVETGAYNGYYGHIFTYSIDSNGRYSIVRDLDNRGTLYQVAGTGHDKSTLIYDESNATITQGQATIDTGVNTYVATNSTVFVVRKTANSYSYTVYTGKDNVPSMIDAELCIRTDENGYATLVVVTAKDALSQHFLGFVTDADIDEYGNPLGAGYQVYPLGETEPVMLYDSIGSFEGNVNTALSNPQTGLYEFEVNASNQIKTMIPALADLDSTHFQTGDAYHLILDPTGTANLTNVGRYAVVQSHKGTSFQAIDFSALKKDPSMDYGYDYTDGNKFADFNINSDTKILVVSKNNIADCKASIRAGSTNDIEKGAIVLFTWNTRFSQVSSANSLNDAKVVYVIKLPSYEVPERYAAAITKWDADKFELTYQLYRNGDAFDGDETIDVQIRLKGATNWGTLHAGVAVGRNAKDAGYTFNDLSYTDKLEDNKVTLVVNATTIYEARIVLKNADGDTLATSDAFEFSTR